MGTRYLTGFLAALALFSLPASGEPAELDAAIDAYLRDDFTRMDVIERYADEAHPDALAVLGQACFYGLGCEQDRSRGLKLLKQAAEAGDRPSAVQLGRIYENGSSDIEADATVSARWYVMAAEAGDTLSAPPGLRRLPRDAVIKAGGETWLDPTQTEQVAEIEPQPTPSKKPLPPLPTSPSPKPAPQAAPQTTAPEAGEELTITDDMAIALTEAMFGPPPQPASLVMADGTAFPLYATTGMSDLGDAAASCMVDMDPEVERLRTRLEGLIAEARTGSAAENVSIKADVQVVSTELEHLMIAYRTARDVLRNPTLNGGYGDADIDLPYADHLSGRDARPDSGPGARFCRDNFPQLMAELAASQP